MPQCPHCNGDGKYFAHLNTPDPETHGFQWVKCQDCDGYGIVNAAALERWERGRALREERISRGVSLFQEAKRLGLTPTELSRRERGKQ